jgi:hypothetical protein
VGSIERPAPGVLGTWESEKVRREEVKKHMLKEQIIKSFAGSRGGFSKESLAAGGIFASTAIVNCQLLIVNEYPGR